MIGKLLLLAIVALGVGLAVPSTRPRLLNPVLNRINNERRCKIVTIEDPIEYVHQNDRAIIVQQEVLTDVHSFNRALDCRLGHAYRAAPPCERIRLAVAPQDGLSARVEFNGEVLEIH